MENTFKQLDNRGKIIAVGAITGDYSWFKKDVSELTDHQWTFIDNTLYKHAQENGNHGVIMAAKVGKAIIASIEYPIKPRTGLVQRFKNKVKELLS